MKKYLQYIQESKSKKFKFGDLYRNSYTSFAHTTPTVYIITDKEVDLIECECLAITNLGEADEEQKVVGVNLTYDTKDIITIKELFESDYEFALKLVYYMVKVIDRSVYSSNSSIYEKWLEEFPEISIYMETEKFNI